MTKKKYCRKCGRELTKEHMYRDGGYSSVLQCPECNYINYFESKVGE